MRTFFAAITPSFAKVVRAATSLFSSFEAESIVARGTHKRIVRFEALAHSDVLTFATIFGWNIAILTDALVVSKLIDTLARSTRVISTGTFIDVDAVSAGAVELISFGAVTVVTSIQVSTIATFARTSHGGALVDVLWNKSNAVRLPAWSEGAKLKMFGRTHSRADFAIAFNSIFNLGPAKTSSRATALSPSCIRSNQVRADSVFNLSVAVTLSKIDTTAASGNICVVRGTFAGERSDCIPTFSTKANA